MEDLKSLIRLVIKTGGLFALLSVIISTSLYFVMFINVNDVDPSAVVADIFIFVIPAITIVLLGETLLIPILFMWEIRLSNTQASLLGALVGIILVSISNYTIWQLFFAYMNYVFEYAFQPFIVPGIIDIIALTYIGWKINGFKNQQSISLVND